MAEEELKKLEVTYIVGRDSYKAVFSAKSGDVFIQAALQPEILSKAGEDLVAAISAFGKGKISRIDRYKNDLRNNGVNGEPAVEEFHENGNLMWQSLFTNGAATDAPDGTPCVRHYHENGSIASIQHYKNNQRNDGPQNDPAHRVYNQAGILVSQIHLKNGKPHDGADGEYAIQNFSKSGKLVYAASFKDGALQKTADLQGIFNDKSHEKFVTMNSKKARTKKDKAPNV